jgi:hypothetical protein
VRRWHDRDGVLWLHSVLPEPRHLAIVGGPARKELIPDGPHRGRSYVGGDPNGFEHLVLPASRPKPANAWYRLGKPTLLGPEFGIRPHWGRVEIEPAEPDETYLFVNTVVIDEAESRTPPDIRWQNTEGRIAVTISLGQSRAELVLSDAGSIGGELRLDAPERLRWVLPDDIMDDDALPLR